MTEPPPFFIGWAAEASSRRTWLRAGAALAGGGSVGLAAWLLRGRTDLGPGDWDTARTHTLRGTLLATPYPALRMQAPDGRLRTVFLASDGKASAALPPGLVGRAVAASGSLITRGDHAMLVVEDRIQASDGPVVTGGPSVVELGELVTEGEVLDAKCWFGAMRPGYGKTHKACAALCARGRLPLAFCRRGTCGAATQAPLFLDADGRPHGEALLPFVADPVFVRGRLVRVDDVVQLRADLSNLRRI